MECNFQKTLNTWFGEYFKDDEVCEIRVTDNGSVFITRDKDKGRNRVSEKINLKLNPEEIRKVCEEILVTLEKENNEKYYDDDIKYTDLISTILPNGMRFEGVLEIKGINFTSPFFTIKKYSEKDFDFSSYLTEKNISFEDLQEIQFAIKNKKNILVVGQHLSGKTSFLNACLKEIEKSNERQSIAVLQNVPNIKSTENVEINFLTEHNKINKAINLLKYFKTDRVIIDDLSENLGFFELTKLMDRGRKGFIFSVNATNVLSGITKFEEYVDEFLCRTDNFFDKILNNIDLIIHLERNNSFRNIKIHKLLGFDTERKVFITDETNN